MGPDPVARAAALLEALGPQVWLYLREPDLPLGVLWQWIAALAPVAAAHGSHLFVPERADLVLSFAHPAVGLHLPERGLPVRGARRLLGPRVPIVAAAHDRAGALAKAEDGATAVTVSPVFATPSKPGEAPLGVRGFGEIRETLRGTPALLFALGGVDLATAGQVWEAGADGIGAIRAAWEGEPTTRIELVTYGLRNRCSTD